MVSKLFSFTQVRNWCFEKLKTGCKTYFQGYEIIKDVCSLWDVTSIYLVLVFNKSIRENEDDSYCTRTFAHNAYESLNTSLTVASIYYCWHSCTAAVLVT